MRKYLLVVEYHELQFGFRVKKTEEFLVEAADLKIEAGGAVVVERHTAKQTRRMTYAASMVKDLRELKRS